jgi:hypothetical protein
MIKILFLILAGTAYGVLSSAGVFTVLAAVGLVPRFAGRTHTADKVLLYEEMVIFGTIVGCIFSVFSRYCTPAAWLLAHFPNQLEFWRMLGRSVQLVFGFFAGTFIGCLALAIAEMLDSIPIFTRRISFRHGLGWAILSMAAGKLCGALLYFLLELHRTVA